MPNRNVVNVIANRAYLIETPEKTLRTVAEKMKKLSQGAVLVVDQAQGQLIGICTERDLVFKALAEGLDPNLTTLSNVMTREPETIEPEAPFGHALHKMFEGGFRHLPVVDKLNRPIGVVSARDALGIEMLRFGKELECRESLLEIL